MLTRALAAAAALLASGCGGTTAVEPAEPLTPVPAIDADSNKSLRTAADPASTPAVEYVNVTGQGVVDFDSVDDAQWGATPRPGVKIGHRSPVTGKVEICTLGPAVRSKTGRTGFLTAGHCAASGAQQYLAPDPYGADAVPFGVVEKALDVPGDDSGVIWIEGPAPAEATLLAGTWPITGVMPVNEIRGLEPGTRICINGAVSGVVCGGFIDADDAWIRYRDIADEGDSGSAVFVVDGAGNATLIGVHSGYPRFDPNTSQATPLELVLRRLGVEAVTA